VSATTNQRACCRIETRPGYRNRAQENYLFIHMAKQKKKLSPAQKAAKKKRQKEYMTIFMNGKQKRVKRPATIDGMDADEFIRRNADPIWLHQNEMWEYMDQTEDDDLF
jgi:hypothetical protein